MNADLLRRLIRAIASGKREDIGRMAEKAVEAERRRGHVRLAEELEHILAGSNAAESKRSPNQTPSSLRELPLSRRQGEQLVTLCPRETLEHHMVLPPAIEARFARIEREYAARERLSAYGLTPTKTVLLYGPPGCGKSLGAKRIAWNVGLPLMKVRFDALISSFFGESASNLRSVFDATRERPCVLLLDECDFIGRSRVNVRDVGEAGRIVNTLLQLMEEYDAPGLLVATTNIEGSLDSAIFRRFDDVLQVPPPGRDQVEQLLRLTLSAITVSPTVDWGGILQLLEHASAAEVVKVAEAAAKSAVLVGGRIVEDAHLRQAISELRRAGPHTSKE